MNFTELNKEPYVNPVSISPWFYPGLVGETAVLQLKSSKSDLAVIASCPKPLAAARVSDPPMSSLSVLIPQC